MTDETFISEKTGKKYRFKGIPHFKEDGFLGTLSEIIEPKLEVGDWWQDDDGGLHHIKDIDIDSPISDRVCYEIRKVNGEVWKKINGEWVKL